MSEVKVQGTRFKVPDEVQLSLPIARGVFRCYHRMLGIYPGGLYG
jgi:hypothetical protein